MNGCMREVEGVGIYERSERWKVRGCRCEVEGEVMHEMEEEVKGEGV